MPADVLQLERRAGTVAGEREVLANAHKMTKQTFSAFYPSQPFWAGNAIDFSQILPHASNYGQPGVSSSFRQLMSEEVFIESNEAYTLKIARDGMIMLRVEALEKLDHRADQPLDWDTLTKTWGEYLELLNAFYLLLDSSILKSMNFAYFSLHEITHRDAFRITFENGKWTGNNGLTHSLGSVFQQGRDLHTYGELGPQFDFRMMMRHVIPLQAIADAAKQFDVAVKTPGLPAVLSAFTKSIAEYKLANFDTSLILAWFISERIINQLWADYIGGINKDMGDGNQRFNSKRLQSITGRNFAVAMAINMLEICEVLPFQLFKDLNTVRDIRNKIAHGQKERRASMDDAGLAINSARDLTNLYYGVQFMPNLALTRTGL